MVSQRKKFERGQKVRLREDVYKMPVGTILIVDDAGFGWFEAQPSCLKPGWYCGPYNPDCFELVDSSPVRTVTRKEIVPGTYGDVLVDRTDNDGSLVVLGFKSCGNIFPQVRSRFSASDLRAAAATFIELADALEDV